MTYSAPYLGTGPGRVDTSPPFRLGRRWRIVSLVSAEDVACWRRGGAPIYDVRAVASSHLYAPKERPGNERCRCNVLLYTPRQRVTGCRIEAIAWMRNRSAAPF